jgi:RimJ/RimL family protein N-acetyltransferase
MTLLDLSSSETLREASTPVIETERLILRAPHIDDVRTVVALANDRRVAEGTARIPHPYRVSDAKEWIDSVNRPAGEETFLITLADGTIIGACGLHLRDAAAPDIGYWLGVAHWGRGCATEAVRALIDYAFGELDHEVLQAGARVANPASRRLLEKCGFQWTGVGLYRIRAINSSAPVDRFRLERRVWASLKRWGQTKTSVRRVA